jgi:hypothetical protein
MTANNSPIPDSLYTPNYGRVSVFTGQGGRIVNRVRGVCIELSEYSQEENEEIMRRISALMPTGTWPIRAQLGVSRDSKFECVHVSDNYDNGISAAIKNIESGERCMTRLESYSRYSVPLPDFVIGNRFAAKFSVPSSSIKHEEAVIIDLYKEILAVKEKNRELEHMLERMETETTSFMDRIKNMWPF